MKEYYDRPRATLPSLTFVKVQGSNAGRQRLPNSARREGCLLLLFAMIKYLDLARLCVGVPTPEGFLTLKLQYLAQQAGISLRRAERALHDLKGANIVTVSELCEEQEDGSFVGIAAIKAINKDLFAAFGLTKWLKDERGRASQRQRRDTPISNPKQLAKLRILIGASGKGGQARSQRRRIRRPMRGDGAAGRATTGPPDIPSRQSTAASETSLSGVIGPNRRKSAVV